MAQVDARQLELEVVPIDPPATRLRRAAAEPRPRGLRLALSPDEAAEALGVSRDYLDEHILCEVRSVRRGRRILIPVRELERWLDSAGTRRGVCGRPVYAHGTGAAAGSTAAGAATARRRTRRRSS